MIVAALYRNATKALLVPKMGRLPSLDVARLMCVLAVVGLHAVQLSEDSAADHFAWYIVWRLAPIRMPLLMLISGFLTAGIVGEPRRAWARVRNILWIFAIWSAVTLAASPGESITQLPAEFLNPTTPLWYLWVMALLTACLAVLSRVAVVGLAVLLGGASLYWSGPEPTGLGFVSLLRYGPFFCVGALAPAAVRWLLTAPAVWLLPVAVVGVALEEWGSQAELNYPLRIFLVGPFLCVTALLVARLISAIPWLGALFATGGQRTVALYVAHPLVLVIVARAFGRASLPLSFCTTVVICFLLYGVAQRARAGWLYEYPDWNAASKGGPGALTLKP